MFNLVVNVNNIMQELKEYLKSKDHKLLDVTKSINKTNYKSYLLGVKSKHFLVVQKNSDTEFVFLALKSTGQDITNRNVVFIGVKGCRAVQLLDKLDDSHKTLIDLLIS